MANETPAGLRDRAEAFRRNARRLKLLSSGGASARERIRELEREADALWEKADALERDQQKGV